MIFVTAKFIPMPSGGRAVQSALAHELLRALLVETTGRGDWRLAVDLRGKPWVVDPEGLRGPAVSLSHTRGLVAAGIAASGRLGIDVERHRRRDFGALAAQAFCPRQQSEVAEQGAAAFYPIWTRREALAKATGAGLSQAANGRPWEEAGWHSVHLLAETDCSLTVALDQAFTLLWSKTQIIAPPLSAEGHVSAVVS